ncbi:hypothetical protein FQ185_04630 [Pseudomonas sp. ANT_H12B]|nr:hypothetical protein FQ185_04630 [Pseudomonas sp. ANT_H12B]
MCTRSSCNTWRKLPSARTAGGWKFVTQPVGASLLAIAAAQSTLMSPDTPLSRAGSLPQWTVFRIRRKRMIWTVTSAGFNASSG